MKLPKNISVKEVADELLKLDLDGSRTAEVIRNTFDQLYNGRETGRYRWDQLHSTERKYCGSVLAINLHREFDFVDGQTLDYCIAGVEVDCKYSQTIGAWMIPPELTFVPAVFSADFDSNRAVIRTLDFRLNKGALEPRTQRF